MIKFVCFRDFLPLSMSFGGEDLDDSIMISPGVMERPMQPGRLSVLTELTRGHDARLELVLDSGSVFGRSRSHTDTLGGGCAVQALVESLRVLLVRVGLVYHDPDRLLGSWR